MFFGMICGCRGGFAVDVNWDVWPESGPFLFLAPVGVSSHWIPSDGTASASMVLGGLLGRASSVMVGSMVSIGAGWVVVLPTVGRC